MKTIHTGEESGRVGSDFLSAIAGRVNVSAGWVDNSEADRKTWRGHVNDDIKLLGLQPDWVVFRDVWSGFISSKSLTLAKRGKN